MFSFLYSLYQEWSYYLNPFVYIFLADIPLIPNFVLSSVFPFLIKGLIHGALILMFYRIFYRSYQATQFSKLQTMLSEVSSFPQFVKNWNCKVLLIVLCNLFLYISSKISIYLKKLTMEIGKDLAFVCLSLQNIYSSKTFYEYIIT